jgi:hypothetical protein
MKTEAVIVPNGNCCECGRESNCAAPAAPNEPVPEPGDFSLCFYCTSLNVFGDDMVLRAPTEEEVIRAASDPEVQKARRFLQLVPDAERQKTPAQRAAEAAAQEAEIKASVKRLDRYYTAINEAILATFPQEDGESVVDDELIPALSMTIARWIALLEHTTGEDMWRGFQRSLRSAMPDARAKAAKQFPGRKVESKKIDDCDCPACKIRRAVNA